MPVLIPPAHCKQTETCFNAVPRTLSPQPRKEGGSSYGQNVPRVPIQTIMEKGGRCLWSSEGVLNKKNSHPASFTQIPGFPRRRLAEDLEGAVIRETVPPALGLDLPADDEDLQTLEPRVIGRDGAVVEELHLPAQMLRQVGDDGGAVEGIDVVVKQGVVQRDLPVHGAVIGLRARVVEDRVCADQVGGVGPFFGGEGDGAEEEVEEEGLGEGRSVVPDSVSACSASF